MGQKYKQLSLEERYRISFLQESGYSLQKIATILDRSPSTISREIKRNKTKTKGYDSSYAQIQTASRRWKGSKLERDPKLRAAVLDRLAMGWSPEATSNRLAQEQGCKIISYESIYRFIYQQITRTKNYSWRRYLPSGKTKRRKGPRKSHSSISFIKDRVSIHERAQDIEQRKDIGHWEADLMLFSKHGQALLIAHERYSRLTMIFKLQNKEAHPVSVQLSNLFSTLPSSFVKSITFDNGTEFAEHHQLNKMGINTFFCDVYSPWQKGGVENAIGRLRRYLPRKTNLDEVNTEQLLELTALYNLTPRKCLGYKTPSEVFNKQLLHFKCESSSPPSRG